MPNITVSNSIISIKGMYCQRNPMTGTGNEPSVVEKKLLLGGGDAETQQRQRSGSQKSSNGGSSIGGGANYASDLGVSLGITGKITPMGHFKVSVGMDEWHPESVN